MSHFAYGYVDAGGAVMIPARYLYASSFVEGRARVSPDGQHLVGLIDREGRTVCEPRFAMINNLTNGFARVNEGGSVAGGRVQGGHWGLLTPEGELAVPTEYEMLWTPHEETFGAQQGGKWGLAKIGGGWVLEPTYEYIDSFGEGLCGCATASGEGYVDSAGQFVIEPRFEETTAFEQGLAKVKTGGAWGLIDRRGTLLTGLTFDRIGKPTAFGVWVVKGNGVGVVTRQGEILGDAWFDRVDMPGRDGSWPVVVGGRARLLTKEGNLVGDFDELVSGDLYWARQGDRFGIVDAQANERAPFVFEKGRRFVGDVGIAQRDGKELCVDAQGRELTAAQYDVIGQFSEGHAVVYRDGLAGLIDEQGHETVSPGFASLDSLQSGRAMFQSSERATHMPSLPEALVVPKGGLDHPVFQGAGPEDHLPLFVSFSRPLGDADITKILQRIDALQVAADPLQQGIFHEDWGLTGRGLYVRFKNLRNPTADVLTLVADFAEAGLPIAEVITSRWGYPWGRDGVMGPLADPSAPRLQFNFGDFPEYWAAFWQGQAASEHPFQLKGCELAGGNLRLEERGTPLAVAGLNIGYGCLLDMGESASEPDARSEQVGRLVANAIEARFRAIPTKPTVPVPMTRSGNPGVEKLAYDGRTGYAFGLSASALAQPLSKARIRYREPELMEALLEATRAAELEPAVLWQRLGTPTPSGPLLVPTDYVVNLWERR